jgi:hypothetical protein
MLEELNSNLVASYEYNSTTAVLFAGCIVLIAMFWIFKIQFSLTNEIILQITAFFTLLLPFVLPYMHERYWYPAEIVLLIYAICYPKKWWYCAVLQFCSFQTYTYFLYSLEKVKAEYMMIMVLLVHVALIKDLHNSMAASPLDSDIDSESVSETNETEEIPENASTAV